MTQTPALNNDPAYLRWYARVLLTQARGRPTGAFTRMLVSAANRARCRAARIASQRMPAHRPKPAQGRLAL